MSSNAPAAPTRSPPDTRRRAHLDELSADSTPERRSSTRERVRPSTQPGSRVALHLPTQLAHSSVAICVVQT